MIDPVRVPIDRLAVDEGCLDSLTRRRIVGERHYFLMVFVASKTLDKKDGLESWYVNSSACGLGVSHRQVKCRCFGKKIGGGPFQDKTILVVHNHFAVKMDGHDPIPLVLRCRRCSF